MISNSRYTAFDMGCDTIEKIRRVLIDKKSNLNYKRDTLLESLDELAFILDYYPVLTNHKIWEDVEGRFVLEKLRNSKLGSMVVHLPNNKRGNEILVIDYVKNKSYVRKKK